MSIYNYKNAALIDRVEVDSPRPPIVQATMVAAENADSGQLQELRKSLGKLGYSTLMDTSGQRATIQVRGLHDENSFIQALEKLDLGHDGVGKDLQKAPDKQEGFVQKVRGKSLFLSALFYDLGNIALGVSGVQRGRHNPGGKFTKNDISEIMTGAAFAVGDVLMTYYGKDRGDEELRAADQGLRKYLHQKGIEIPQGDALNPDTLHQSGVMKGIDRWLHRHIAHVKCLTELTGGLFMIHSGMKRDKITGNMNRFKVAAGSLIAVAWASTFLLEKPRGEHIFKDKEDHDHDGVWDKMKNNPRALIAAPLAMSNNVFNLLGANNERKEGLAAIAAAEESVKLSNSAAAREKLQYAQAKQHDYLWNILTASSFLVAHSLFGMSGSKGPSSSDDDARAMNDMVLLSANLLAQQPEKVRDTAIAETASFVSGLAHIKHSPEEVEKAIRDKVNALSQSTWASRIQNAPDDKSPVVAERS